MYMPLYLVAAVLLIAVPTARYVALGVVLYQVVTGIVPFVGTKSEVIHQHATMTPVPLMDRVPDLPCGLDTIIAACLAKRAEDRPSVREVREGLAECYRQATGRPPEQLVRHCQGREEVIRVGRRRVQAFGALGGAPSKMALASIGADQLARTGQAKSLCGGLVCLELVLLALTLPLLCLPAHPYCLS